MDNNGKFDCNAISMGRDDRKKTGIYKKMKASYITLRENCTYFNVTKKIMKKQIHVQLFRVLNCA